MKFGPGFILGLQGLQKFRVIVIVGVGLRLISKNIMVALYYNRRSKNYSC